MTWTTLAPMQRAEADRRPAVVGKDQEGAAIGQDAAMLRHAVHRRGHAELADPVIDVAAAVIFGVSGCNALVLVLLEPVRSAEPPIVRGQAALIASSAISDALRVATLGGLASSSSR